MTRISFALSLVAAACFVTSIAACGDDSAPTGVDAGADATATADSGPDANTVCPNPLPPPAQCDFFLSCGCNTPTEKCSATQTGKGCTNAGTKLAGELCANDTECSAGTVCAMYGGALRCMAYCDDSHTCEQTPLPQACYIKVTANQVQIGSVCGQVCDLRTQDCLYDGQGCYPSTTLLNQMDHGICATAGAGQDGAACTLANDCAEGYTCISSDSKCHKFCDRAGGNPMCGTGQTCMALAGHTATGFCQ
jgi:hypothetical protein